MEKKLIELLKRANAEPLLETEIKTLCVRLQAYFAEILKWNQRINLISKGSEKRILETHFFDSLHYLRGISSQSRVLDIGSGAGFPGIPIKLMKPDIQLVLVESIRKKANFLADAIRVLGIEKAKAHWDRAENLSNQSGFFGEFDVVIMRAVCSLEEGLNLAGVFLKPGGKFLVKKEQNVTLSADNSGFKLAEEIPVENFEGLVSKLMIFKKCST